MPGTTQKMLTHPSPEKFNTFNTFNTFATFTIFDVNPSQSPQG